MSVIPEYYERNFRISEEDVYLMEKIVFRIEKEDNQTNEEAINEARDAAIKSHKERYPHLYQRKELATPPVAQPEIENRSLLQIINSCTILEKPNGLRSYETFINLSGTPEEKLAYRRKEKELLKNKN